MSSKCNCSRKTVDVYDRKTKKRVAKECVDCGKRKEVREWQG